MVELLLRTELVPSELGLRKLGGDRPELVEEEGNQILAGLIDQVTELMTMVVAELKKSFGLGLGPMVMDFGSAGGPAEVHMGLNDVVE
ncbi:hypothetical protein M0R45_000124 [Rubus argutus]|uniref:Uncharacterized protein n=1 Tax=Rubus argutus TaxID=59490 RepID=A0AAW1VLQ5_RUBAR